MDQVPETQVSDFGNAMEKGVKGKLKKAFLHFFGILDDYSKWNTPKALRN